MNELPHLSQEHDSGGLANNNLQIHFVKEHILSFCSPLPNSKPNHRIYVYLPKKEVALAIVQTKI